MPQVNQVQNLILRNAPPNVQAEAEAGADAVKRAGAPSAPYTSRAAGMLNALQGGLGGLMEGHALQQAAQGRQAAAAGAYGWLNALQPGAAGAPPPSPMNTAAPGPQPGQGGAIGSDYVASRQAASHSAWLASIAPQAQRVAAQLDVDPRLVMAQAALESNYGKSAPGNNLFGIKGAGTGPVNTMESINGVMTPTKASFASYDSPDASFAGYGKLMSGPRYAGVRGAQGLDAQIAALGRSGYATDPNYAAKIATIAKGIDPGILQAPQGAPAAAPGASVAAGAGARNGVPGAPAAAGAGPIGDAAALAAQNRLTSGQGTAADRALLATYRQQQNTPPTAQTAAAAPASDGTVRGDLLAAAAQHGMVDPDAPAPGATPTGMQGLPPGVTPAMFAASQGAGRPTDGNALNRAVEIPAGTAPYSPGQPPAASGATLADALMAHQGDAGASVGQGPATPALLQALQAHTPDPGQGQLGPVTASGVPHQLAPGAGARADSGVGAGIGGVISTPGGATEPELDPEGTGPQNYDPNAGPSLRDTLTAQFKKPGAGQVQPAAMPDPAPLGASDKVLQGGLVEQPAGPSTLPGPLGRPTGPGAQPAPVPPPAPLAPGDAVGADGTVTPAPSAPPSSDSSLRGDIMSAMAQGGTQVPDPVGSFGDLPTPAEDAVGPQTDAAMGNAVPGQGPMGAPPAAMQAALPDAGPMPPPGAQSLQAPADAASAEAAAAAPSLDPEAVGLPGAEPSLRDHIAAQVLGSGAGTSGPQSDAATSLAPSAAPSPAHAPGSVDDFGRTTAQAMGGGSSTGPAVSASGSGSPAAAPGIPGPVSLAAMGGPGVPPPTPQAGAGQGGADLSKLAVGPLTPGYMAGLANALSGPMPSAGAASQPGRSPAGPNPDAPAPAAVQAGPQPLPPPAMAPAQSMPSFGGSGTNAPAGNSPSADPSSAQNFMRAEAARGSSPTPGGFMASLGPLFSPAAPRNGGTGLMMGPPQTPAPSGGPGGSPQPSAPQPGGGGSVPAPASAGAPQQGTPDQARAIAQQVQANPSASPASQAVAGQVMAATGGQGAVGQGAGASPAAAPAPGAAVFGGMTPEQRQAGLALLTGPNAMYLDPSVKEAIAAKLFPQPQKLSQGEGLVGLRSDGTYGSLYTQPGTDKFAYSPDGVHVLNKTTGQVTMPGADGSGGAGSWRPMTPTEMQRYGVTDGRPAYIAPNGEPHFGMPGTQGQGETEEAKESGKAAAGRQDTMLNAANAAPMKIARLDLIGQVLDKTQTGPLAGEMGTAAAIASRIGVAPERMAALGIDPNQAVNNAIANKLAGEMTMSSIGAKNGGMPASNFSVAERQFIEALYPNIENMPGANRMVIDVLKTAEQRNAQIASEWADYKDQQRGAGKALSYGDFEDSFRRAHAQDNIFAPIIQRYQAGGYTPAAPSPGGMPSAAPAGGGQGGALSMGQPGSAAAQMPGQGGGYLPGAARGAPPPVQGGGQMPRNVAPGVTGGSPQPQPGQGADPLSQARVAIAAGAPRAAVIQRLQGMGINAAGL